jgi:hypothetical protein
MTYEQLPLVNWHSRISSDSPFQKETQGHPSWVLD